MSQWAKRLTLAATVVGSSMALLDSSVVNVALPAMQRALHTDAGATQWIVTSYLLFLGAFVLIGGSVADLYGRRTIFVLGILIFLAGSISAGLAPGIAVLIGSRAVQGFGAALLTPASLAILETTFDESERSAAIGLWAGAGALMMAFGPTVGGWLVDHLSWRAIFLINIPLAVIATGLMIRFAADSRDSAAKQLDWAGAALVVAGLATWTWSLNAIPSSGFHDRKVLITSLLGTLCLGLFVITEARLGACAMMPLSLFRIRNFWAANALTLLLYFAVSGSLYFLPFALIRVGGYSATAAGAALAPFALLVGFGAPLVGRVADRVHPRLLLTFGPLIVATGFVALAFVDVKQAYWFGVFPIMMILGLGMAITVPPLTSMVLRAAGESRAGIASGINNAVARIGGLLAIATLGVLFFASFSSHLMGMNAAQANAALAAVMRGQTSTNVEAVAAFRQALQIIWFALAACAVCAGLIGFLGMRDTPRDQRA